MGLDHICDDGAALGPVAGEHQMLHTSGGLQARGHRIELGLRELGSRLDEGLRISF